MCVQDREPCCIPVLLHFYKATYNILSNPFNSTPNACEISLSLCFVYVLIYGSFLFVISVSHTSFLLPGPAVARAVGAAVGTAATGTNHMTMTSA